jgi:pimeloyl-ACP methyl ester carboxylesterase
MVWRTLTLGDGVTMTVESGSLRVPQNRARPGQGTIEIAFYRLRSTAAHPATPIFLLAGGPGSSALAELEDGEGLDEVELYRSVADVIVFDQRGAGRSQPAPTCTGSASLPLDEPLDLGRVAEALSRMLAACREQVVASGFDLAGLTTVESAADVDALRAALGYSRVTLIGGSYGSHLALAVMRGFPDAIDRVVLHGVEGPDHTWDDPAAKLATLARIAAAAETSAELREKVPPGGLLRALADVIERLEAEPILVTIDRDGQPVSVVVDATVARMAVAAKAGQRRRAGAWPAFILELHRGHLHRLAELAIDVRDLHLRADAPMYFTMECASGISPERARRIERDPARAIVGDVNFGLGTACAAWPAPDLGSAYRAPVVSAIPTLLVHGTWDTKAPIDNAREVVRTLSRGQLVEVEGGGHGALAQLFAEWPPLRTELAAFLRGDDVRFPAKVSLPPVSFAWPGGTP